jgi:2-dehydro-3-deoxygluconokinase
MIAKKTVTFGELLLRLHAPGFERLLQSPTLQATFGGGEANVAVSLAHFGLDSRFVTRLPSHAIGEAGLRALRGEGVDVRHVQRGGHRVGIYFSETGASQRPSVVIYDRAHSAVSEIDPPSVPWTEILADASWFHTTGITPALGERALECTRIALAMARAAGVPWSIDLNYRRKLWSEEHARRTMRTLVRGADLLIANEEDLQASLGIPVARADVAGGRVEPAAYRAACEAVVADYGIKQVAVTLRASTSATENGWSALLYDSSTRKLHEGPRYTVHLVDRIGGGDSFAAGLIYATIERRAPAEALRFAVAASALQQAIPGDFNRVSVTEVERLSSGDASGRVQR